MNREDFYNRIYFLSPNSKFVFYANDELSDKRGYESPLYQIDEIDDWILVWYPENIDLIPTLSDIQNVDPTELANFLEQKRKDDRNARYSNDLSMKAAYLIAKASDPELTFSDYLDQVEVG